MKKIHIDLKETPNLFFTSDLHFGHRNILDFCDRPFTDVKDMRDSLIANWNNTVTNDDIVFILGDVFWFNDSHTIKKVLDALHGKTIYILPGNHDDFESYHRVDSERIILLDDIVVLYVSNLTGTDTKSITEIWLSHYPLATYPHKENGAIQFFGHIHSCKNPDIVHRCDIIGKDLIIDCSKQCDVGCDYWDYKPVKLQDLWEYLKSYK